MSELLSPRITNHKDKLNCCVQLMLPNVALHKMNEQKFLYARFLTARFEYIRFREA